MIKLIKNNLYLFKQLVRKDIQNKYQGSVLGILWSFLVPMIMLTIYTFVFSEIFKAKWNIETQNKFEFALVLFCGLSAYNMIAEVMNRSTTLIEMNHNYVKKVVFPLELLPVIITCSALFNSVISYMILIIANFILVGVLSSTLYQLIFVMMPLIMICIGVSYFLSALSVYLKDMTNVVGVLVMVLMYISPVFFPLTSVPEKFRIICMLNPMTYIIENSRNVVLYSENANIYYLGISFFSAFIILTLGRIVFMRAKNGFADVL